MTALYTVQHLTFRQIGAIVNRTHTAVAKALKRAGVTTREGEWVNLRCDVCSGHFSITRSRWRNSIKHYCTWECRVKSLENPNYVDDRTGRRHARKIIATVFALQVYHAVHHWDSDRSDNSLDNLAVFASAAEHHSYERGGFARPIWDGRTYQAPT